MDLKTRIVQDPLQDGSVPNETASEGASTESEMSSLKSIGVIERVMMGREFTAAAQSDLMFILADVDLKNGQSAAKEVIAKGLQKLTLLKARSTMTQPSQALGQDQSNRWDSQHERPPIRGRGCDGA